MSYWHVEKMTPSKSSHVKDKNRIFTLYDKKIEFQNLPLQIIVYRLKIYQKSTILQNLAIYTNKLLNSDWLRAGQFKRNTNVKNFYSSANKTSWFWNMIGWKAIGNFLSQWYHVKWWRKFCTKTLKIAFSTVKKGLKEISGTSYTRVFSCLFY